MVINVSIRKLNDFIEKERPVIIDIREKEEFIKFNIEDSINMKMSEIENIKNIIKNKDRAILVCCNYGITSMAVALELEDMGYKRVYNLEEGVRGWS